MPVDQKRINGPEITSNYTLKPLSEIKSYEDRLKYVLNDGSTRLDKRQFVDMRKMFLKAGVVSQAKGSAYIELGNTKVIVSVFDPREIPKQNKYSVKGELFCDFRFSPFASQKRKSLQTTTDEKCMALAMKRAIEPAVCRQEFPNFQVDVYANVLEDDGSVLGAAITCAGLALADAGIPMYDVITASTVAIVDGKIISDPTKLEEDFTAYGINDCGIMMIARLPTQEQVTEIWQNGNLSMAFIAESVTKLIDLNNMITPIVKQILVAKVNDCINAEIELINESIKTQAAIDS